MDTVPDRVKVFWQKSIRQRLLNKFYRIDRPIRGESSIQIIKQFLVRQALCVIICSTIKLQIEVPLRRRDVAARSASGVLNQNQPLIVEFHSKPHY